MPWLPSLTPGRLCEWNTWKFFLDALSILTGHVPDVSCYSRRDLKPNVVFTMVDNPPKGQGKPRPARSPKISGYKDGSSQFQRTRSFERVKQIKGEGLTIETKTQSSVDSPTIR